MDKTYLAIKMVKFLDFLSRRQVLNPGTFPSLLFPFLTGHPAAWMKHFLLSRLQGAFTV